MVNKQRGFTLVEIAIVLVIIGLLLGGILKGQELITSARVRNFADLAAGVQTAYYGFIDRYREVPGDMPGTQACTAISGTAWTCPAGVGGSGNGAIDSGAFGEAAAAWSHMAAAGFLQGNYPGTATADGTGAGAYRDPATPQAPINPWNGFLLLGSSNDYMNVTENPPPRLHLIMGRNVPVNIMRELDVKVDDSQPDTGILRSAANDGAPAFATVSGSATGAGGCVLAGPPATWDITADAQDCNGFFLY